MTEKQNIQPDPDETAPPEVTPDVTPEATPEEPTDMPTDNDVAADEGNTPADGDAVEASETSEQAEPDLQLEIDQLNDKLLRSMADYQNLARRSQISIQQAREQAIADLGKAMITALDHFDHAVQVDPEKVTAQTVLDGVTMVRDELLRTLGQYEINRIDASPGDEFDPNQHEALMRTDAPEDGDIASGQIVMQLQPGYRIGERVIRPAQVSLAN